mgnify:CR=1 FL=1
MSLVVVSLQVSLVGVPCCGLCSFRKAVYGFERMATHLVVPGCLLRLSCQTASAATLMEHDGTLTRNVCTCSIAEVYVWAGVLLWLGVSVQNCCVHNNVFITACVLDNGGQILSRYTCQTGF